MKESYPRASDDTTRPMHPKTRPAAATRARPSRPGQNGNTPQTVARASTVAPLRRPLVAAQRNLPSTTSPDGERREQHALRHLLVLELREGAVGGLDGGTVHGGGHEQPRSDAVEIGLAPDGGDQGAQPIAQAEKVEQGLPRRAPQARAPGLSPHYGVSEPHRRGAPRRERAFRSPSPHRPPEAVSVAFSPTAPGPPPFLRLP